MPAEAPIRGESQPHNTRDFYVRRLLGLDHFPDNPGSMPMKVQLTPELLGSLGLTITATATDKRERSQLIFYDAKNDIGIPTRVIVGKQNDIGIRAVIAWGLRTIAKTPLIHFHTHPDTEGFSSFSYTDVVNARVSPKLGYIFLVGSQYGVGGLLHTGESRRYNRPTKSDILDYLYRHMEQGDHNKIASAAAPLGLAYYLWESPTGVAQEDLNQSISLSKVPITIGEGGF